MNLSIKILFAFYFILPAIAFLRPWPLMSLITSSGTLLFSMLIFCVSFISLDRRRLAISPVILIFSSCIFSVLVSVYFSTYILSVAWRWYFLVLVFSIFLALSVSEVKYSLGHSCFLKYVSKLMYFCSVFYAVASLLKYYGVINYFFSGIASPSDQRLTGVWDQPNLTTSLEWIGALASVGFLVNGKFRRVKLILYYVSIFLIGWTVALAASRLSWVYAFVALFSALLSLYFSRDRVGNVQVRVICVVVIFIFLIFFVPYVNELVLSYMRKFGFLFHADASSLIERGGSAHARLSEFLKVIHSVAHMGWSSLAFGIGPGNYASFSANADLTLPSARLYDFLWTHSHNIFSMVFEEQGILGIITISLIIFFVFRRIWQLRSDSEYLWVSIAITFIFIHSNLEFPLWYPWFLALTCIFLVGIFDVNSCDIDSKLTKPFISALVLSFGFAFFYDLATQVVPVVRVSYASHPSQKDYDLLAEGGYHGLIGPYSTLRLFRSFEPEDQFLRGQLHEIDDIASWRPLDMVRVRRFQVLTMLGDLGASCKEAKNTAKLYPYTAPILFGDILKLKKLSSQEAKTLFGCVSAGLEFRGETFSSSLHSGSQR